MASRLDLQNKLEELSGHKNVYYQPPESIKMEYQAIRYSKKSIQSIFANDARYSGMTCYEVIVIDRLPDSETVSKILNLPYCRFDRHYVADNLHHDVFTLYY